MGSLFQSNGEEKLFIKQIVGLPGDRVEAVQGRLRVNGQPWRKDRWPASPSPISRRNGFRRGCCL
ncbi:S26 family signal peptidase [Planifilum fulgidum]|uniref:S26 family signal peptidase n=1 Tax=Planifilum fulgidum TaxID=201973 RepID=UPI003CCB93FD